MVNEPIEQRNVSLVGYHDLCGRPGFKIDLYEVDDRWYLYTAGFWHSGYTILDVTDPSNPTYVDFVEGPDNTLTLQSMVAEGKLITSLEKPRRGRGHVDGPKPDPSKPYEEGAYIWDIETEPTEPTLLGHYETGGDGTHRNFYDGGDYAYMATVADEYEGRHLAVVDVSDPTDPTEVSKWWWPGQGPDDSEPADETYYFHGPAYVEGDRAYLSYGSVGMVVLDVSDPTDPQFLSRLNFGDFGSWLGCHSAVPIPGTDLLVANSEAILEGTPLGDDGEPLNFTVIVDISDDSEVGFDGKNQTGPRIVSWVPVPTPEPGLAYDNYHEKPGRFGPHNQHHYRPNSERLASTDLLFMTYFNAGLRVFDVSDPLAPAEVGYYVPGDPPERIGRPRPGQGLVSTLEDVVVDTRGYIYCTDPQQGLFVFETDLL